MKKQTIIILSTIAAILLSVIIFTGSKDDGQTLIEAKVLKGEFDVSVNVTGDLQAISSVKITGPTELRSSRSMRIYDLKIQDMIEEGTVVDSGDWVASLDRSQADSKLKDYMDEIEDDERQYHASQLDTTISMRGLRDGIINLQYSLEEREIVLEQSKFEPPATIRQAKINVDKAQRSLDQARKNYLLKQEQAVANMQKADYRLEKTRKWYAELQKIVDRFSITAPASGMVVYIRHHDGTKREIGSEISPWDLDVAELPDLSSMNTRTYINEIDISKIKVGQKVETGVDAFPNKRFTGVVADVANMGEQLPNADARVFQVIIRLDSTDPVLRPSMTTSNKIITASYEDVCFIPMEAVHSNDSIPFVYTKSKHKQIVLLGESNDDMIIVEEGLKEGERIYLNVPDASANWNTNGEDLVEKIIAKQVEKKRLEKEIEKKIKEENSRPKQK